MLLQLPRAWDSIEAIFARVSRMFSFDDFERIINTIADPVFVKDRRHSWVLLNDAYCKFMGVERTQVIGKSDYDFFPKNEADVFWEKDEDVFRAGTENVNDEEFTDSAGVAHSITTKKSLYVSATGEQFIVGCIRDLTELKRSKQDLQHAHDRLDLLVRERTAELLATNKALLQQIAENERTADRLRQANKMEAIGRLAGGIAHDFNNLLNVMIGYASIIEKDAGAASQRENAAKVRTAAEKAASLTRQLLAFSRKQVLQPEVLALNDVLTSMGKMLPPLIREDIELVIVPGPQLGCVKADRGQIEQVIMNLVVNARDAMPLGGKLTIETSNAELSSESAREDGIEPGRYVTLTVTDTGAGMDATTQAHIFEPFFTTKESGKGTGLGLSTVYGIVKHSGGHIRVHSHPGQGTTLKIYLTQVAESVPMTTSRAVEGLSHGSETILLVEDQEDLRTLLREVLRAKGYIVLDANCAKTALETASRYDRRIDLLITDIVMPGMRGWKLAEQLTALRPEMKVLYISGYTDTDLLDENALIAGAALLEKPFSPDALLLKLREMLCPHSKYRQSNAR
jgi:PAS domain S-box-containing protein